MTLARRVRVEADASTPRSPRREREKAVNPEPTMTKTGRGDDVIGGGPRGQAESLGIGRTPSEITNNASISDGGPGL